MFAGRFIRSRHKKTPSANASFLDKSIFEYLYFSSTKKMVSALIFVLLFSDFNLLKTYDLSWIVLAVKSSALQIVHIIERVLRSFELANYLSKLIKIFIIHAVFDLYNQYKIWI